MMVINPHPKSSAAIYTAVTCVLSWSYLWAVRAGLPIPGWAFAAVLMWIPGAISILLRLVFREGFDDAGFCATTWRYWIWALLAPLALATATYLAATLLHQVHITPYLKEQSMFGPVPFRMTWWNLEAGTAGLLAQRFFVVATLGIVIGFAYGLGEEIGWRGYLLPKLVQGGARFPILISGLIWAAWHAPFVLLTFQQHRVLNALLYSLACLTFGVFVSWLRLASGSVFVAAMAHAAYNTFFQDLYDHSFAGPNKWFWAGEVGLLCSVSFGALALWLYQTNRMKLAMASVERGH